MISVRCRSCGRRYDYAKDDCCPGCGAFNRPPKRELVDADGTVRHLSDAEFDERAHAALGKVCFEEKECHEEKSCYEYEARPAAPGKRGEKREKPAAAKMIATLAALIIIAVTSILAILFSVIKEPRRETAYRFDIPAAVEAVEELWEPDERYTDYQSAYIVAEDGSTFRVLDWWREEGALAVELEVEFADSDHAFYATLECLDEDGYSITLEDFDTEVDDTTVLRFLTDDDMLAPQAFVLEEWGEDGDGFISSGSIVLAPTEP